MALRWLSLSLAGWARAQPSALTPTRHFCTGRVFTGTADVRTDKSPDDVATDSNRCVHIVQKCRSWQHTPQHSTACAQALDCRG